jgi:hypothetical protein
LAPDPEVGLAKLRGFETINLVRKRVGEYLVERGMLTVAQVDRIVEHGRKSKLRFGEAAVDLGVLTRDQLYKVFGPSNDTDFFALDPLFYPESTKGLFTAEEMLEYGILPIGVGTEPGFLKTRKVLNLGMLDPERRDSVAFAEMRLSLVQQQPEHPHRKILNGIQATKVFLILTDQFLGILHSAYGIGEETVRSRDAASLDPMIVMYLDTVPGAIPVAR